MLLFMRNIAPPKTKQNKYTNKQEKKTTFYFNLSTLTPAFLLVSIYKKILCLRNHIVLLHARLGSFYFHLIYS